MFRINANGTRQPIQGLLLADTVLPDELENSASETTPARELFDLMREACLGKLTNTMIKADGTVIPINGAAYSVALRMQNSPKAAEIVTSLVHQFPWMKNQHTKRLIRSAVQILKASRQQTPTEQQPAPADSDIALTVSTVEAADSDTWASVLAVDEHDQVIATISNGSVFHPHAVSPEKTMQDTQVKSGAEAMQRFADQLADPAPAMAAKLRLIQEAKLAGHQVRLIVHRALRKQADLIANAVRGLPRSTPAPIATGEYGVMPAKHNTVTYKARVNLDTIDDELADYRTGDLPIAHPPIVLQDEWRKKSDGHWIHIITRRKEPPIARDEEENDHVFRHRTRRAGRQNGLHGEETNSRFDQHDDQIFQMSPLEEMEHAIATSQGEQWALDYALAGDLDTQTASWLTRFGRSREDLTRPRWWRTRQQAKISDPEILPPEMVARTATIKDCRIKRYGPTGALLEGWVIPANYQMAGIKKAIKVADRGRILSRQEQRAINNGDYWAFPNVTNEPTDKPDSFWATWPQLPALRKPEPAAPTTWPQPKPPQPKPQPRHLTDVWVRWWISEHPSRKHHNPSVAALLRQQANTAFARKQSTPPTAKEKRAAKAAAAAQHKAQMYKKPAAPRPFTQRSFTPPPSPAWHEPLTDDDESHVIVTLNDSEHTLAKLVASLIV